MRAGKGIPANSRGFLKSKALAPFFCAVLFCGIASAQARKSASVLFDEGMAFQEERDWWSASEKYQEALEANPSYADAWYRLAQCAAQMDQGEAALDYLQSAKKYSASRSDVLNLEGMVLISLGRLDEAQKIFEDVQKKYPNDIDSRFGLAELNLFKGRVSGAERLYSDALKRSPQNVKALLSLALISAELGKARESERLASQAIQFHAENPQAYYVAAYLALKAGNVSLAEKRCLSSIQVDPDFTAAYGLLSLVYFAQGRYADVIDLADMEISRDRNDGRAWYIKGLALKKTGRVDEAARVWTRGLEAVPQDEVMRAAFELLVRENVPLEDARRKEWAKYHVQKAADFSKKFAGPQMRYECQAALRMDPSNYSARAMLSKILRSEGFSENYLAQIQFVQENEILQSAISDAKNSGKALSADDEKSALVRLSDTVEGYEHLLQDTLAAKWDVNPFYLDKTRWTIGLYCMEKPGPSPHPELSLVAAEHLSLLFRGLLGTLVDIVPSSAESFGRAYADAHKNGYDYFIMFDADEGERDIRLNAQVYSARTGNEAQKFYVYKTGNDRYASALLSLRQGILDILPIRANILERSGNDVLVDIGKTEGLVKGATFSVVRRGSAKTADSGKGLRFKDDDFLGTVTLTDVGEDISEGVLSGTGFYDRVNARDELILASLPKGSESPSGAPEDASPAAGQDGNPADGSAVEAADDPLRGANERNARVPELIDMIKAIY